ncbi:helix-turn-helix transcriptional regulator [Streptomyces spiroverticillatus]|uniref:Helix-turn-helix transcriptional regulator n=1 Tax=Streptomyces finlayi TaxID=67296 RepID=A0A919CDT6_9ACTN|nr:LuxR C-terminal-related transcriptional regulator [Streptomyces finlayi]GHA34252.1 helix-turn-helix transcriptional regulator [Streptomyces spiroverticillatus]GHD11827.1 helix-turn-helix transcriptional regulator [Streptomyces finlayi]
MPETERFTVAEAESSAVHTALACAAQVIQGPLYELQHRLSAALRPLVPHRAVAEMSAHCAHSPVKAHGEDTLASRITGAELDALAATVRPGHPWQGTAHLAGGVHPVLAVSSALTSYRPTLLTLVLPEEAPPLPAGTLALVQALWDVVTAHLDRVATEALPGMMSQSRAVAGERARAIAELSEVHTAALTGLLGTLRSRALDDATARARAVELAVDSLVELRTVAERDQALTEEPAVQAFDRLADSLRPLLRHGPVRLELAPPAEDRPLPADIARTARAVMRTVLLVALEQDPVTRVQVGWHLDAGTDELRATVRDDGPGTLGREAFAVRRAEERLTALGGRLEVDAVPGWGTTVTAALPLGTPGLPESDPLAALGPRELEVLAQLARGHRNRAIAEALHISESTVKFHVKNILSKLSVATRGEAAALAHTLHVVA